MHLHARVVGEECICMHTSVCVHVCGGRTETDIGYLLQLLPVLLFETGSLLNLQLSESAKVAG